MCQSVQNSQRSCVGSVEIRNNQQRTCRNDNRNGYLFFADLPLMLGAGKCLVKNMTRQWHSAKCPNCEQGPTELFPPRWTKFFCNQQSDAGAEHATCRRNHP